MADHDADIDALYAEPLTGFVSARKALVDKLREAGDRAAAKEVGAMQKPSLPAWVINQLVRGERERVDAVLASLDRQRDLQLGALDGSLDPKALQAAREEERAHTSAIAEAAERILEQGGQAASKNNLDRVTKALRSVALSPASREALLRGRLVDDDPPGGFEAAAEQLDPALLLAALSAKPVPKKKRKGGDGLFARSARRTQKTSAAKSSTSEAARDEVGPAQRDDSSGARAEREREEALARERARKARLAEQQAKLAALRLERGQRQAAVETAVGRAEQLQKEVDAARAEARKTKRMLADLDERIRRLEKRVVDE